MTIITGLKALMSEGARCLQLALKTLHEHCYLRTAHYINKTLRGVVLLQSTEKKGHKIHVAKESYQEQEVKNFQRKFLKSEAQGSSQELFKQ